MVLKVYNTLSRRKESFQPLEKGVVRMYVCGITPYDMSHVGHARSYVVFDFIRRSLEYLGYSVRYVQNFTDVDDKIIEKASSEGVHPLELSEKYIAEFYRDMDQLGVRRADSYPKVSEEIPAILKVVEGLIEKGKAYVLEGSVYLDVSKVEGYGKLSGQPIDELRAGARVTVDQNKRQPLDFALWKKAKEGEISWGSPWGHGRPGWHIECSAMATAALGPTLDIHGGGHDLIFPHHENEIAQSEAYTGKTFARYWLHNGLVTAGNEKMSKSLGNFILIRDILKQYSPQVVRFFLLSTHYRKPLDFSERALSDSLKGFTRIQNAIFNAKNSLKTASDVDDGGFDEPQGYIRKDFVDALEDDFNTPRAIAALFDYIRGLNVYLSGTPAKSALTAAIRTLHELTAVFGLHLEEEVPALTRDLIELLISLRADLRSKKDFEASDALREKLETVGVIIEDRKEGTIWRFTDSLESRP